jgi:hypothetical protein
MAGRMTEEKLTKIVLDWLEANHWEIICYDFPQSGTGVLLHSNQSNDKNKGGFIPDIVAIKNKNVVVFENKNRFVLEDYEKIDFLRNTDSYTNAFEKLLNTYSYQTIYYGIAIPLTKSNLLKDKINHYLVDFTIMVDNDNIAQIIFDTQNLF